MKEIIVFVNDSLKLKLLILENSVSFIEEYFQDSETQTKSNINHYNVPIEDIQRIKYSSSNETTKSRHNPIPFIIAVILFVATIIFAVTKLWIPMGIFAIATIILLILGFVASTPEQNSSSQTLVIEGEEKALYSKRVDITDDKLLEIIHSIREKQ